MYNKTGGVYLNKKHLCSGGHTAAAYELAVVTASKIDSTICNSCISHYITVTHIHTLQTYRQTHTHACTNTHIYTQCMHAQTHTHTHTHSQNSIMVITN